MTLARPSRFEQSTSAGDYLGTSVDADHVFSYFRLEASSAAHMTKRG